MLERSQSLLQYCNNIAKFCRTGILLTVDPTLHYKMVARTDDEPVTELQHTNRPLSTLVGNIETDVQS